MNNKIVAKVLEDIPMGGFGFLNKILSIITCWALKTRTFYNIVSGCLEKGGKQIMNIENLEKKLETITKNSTELKKGNRELKEGNRELKESNRELEERLDAIAKNNREDNQELKEDNKELKKGNLELEKKLVDTIAKNNIELKEMLRQLLKNQNNKN